MIKAIDLDELNKKRVETTKLRVAHAIRIIHVPISRMCESDDDFELDNEIIELSHAVNILEAGVEEMEWACKHFGWDTSVCVEIDNAISKLGLAISMMLDPENKDFADTGYIAYDAEIILSKCVASLARWFDDSQDISEV